MPPSNCEIYLSENQNVCLNLAREAYLFDTLPDDTIRFMLYINTASIVIGRHQNPWVEAPVGLLKQKGIQIARRMSGGGTVYHDPGNLNFSFIHAQEDLSKEEYGRFIVKALASLDITAKSNTRGDVVVNGKKVSGHARCFKHGKGIHHGTLLVDSNLNELGFSLKGLKDHITGSSVASVPSPVSNLIEVSPELTIKAATEALINQFRKSFNATASVVKLNRRNDPMKIAEMVINQYTDWQWNFGKTPTFEATFNQVNTEFVLSVRKGKVEKVIENGIESKLTEQLKGCRFHKNHLLKQLKLIDASDAKLHAAMAAHSF